MRLRDPSVSVAAAPASVLVRIALLMGLLLPLAQPAQAQRPTRIWVGIGLGGTASTTSNADATTLMGQLVYQRAPHHFALRGLVSAELYGSLDALGELGLIYGRVFSGGLGHAMIGSGLSYTTHDVCPDEPGGCTSLGVPIVAEVGFSPLTILGVGLQAFANLNAGSTYYGAVAMLQLGWMP